MRRLPLQRRVASAAPRCGQPGAGRDGMQRHRGVCDGSAGLPGQRCACGRGRLGGRAAGAGGRMRAAANGAGRPARAWQRVVVGGWSRRGARQAALTPEEAAPALERARLAPVCPRTPARTAQQDAGALAAPGGGPRWGTGVPGGDGRMRRARSRQRRRAEPYARGPRPAGLRTWRAPPSRQAWAPAGLADPCGWGPGAMAMQAGNLAAGFCSGGVLAPHSAWAVRPCGELATGAVCSYVCTLESGGRQDAPAAAAPLAPMVEAVPAAAADAYAGQGVAAAMAAAAVLTGVCAAAGKAHIGAAVCLETRAGGMPVAAAKL